MGFLTFLVTALLEYLIPHDRAVVRFSFVTAFVRTEFQVFPISGLYPVAMTKVLNQFLT